MKPEEIEQVASEIGVDYDLFLAICTVESSLNPLAMRYEPGWKYFYHVRELAELNHITVETETVLQASSFGVGQIMGSVVRELRFEGQLQQCLSDPLLAARYAAMHLRSFCKKYPDESDVISSYNQGSPRKTKGGLYQNQVYVDRVTSVLKGLRKSRQV